MLGSSWESVLGACRVGAEWAWRQVYEDVAPSLLRFHRARGTPDPEDLVGDTFVRVVRAFPGFDGTEERFRSWVFAISRRRAIDLARTRGRRPEQPTLDADLIAWSGTGDAEADAIRSIEEQRVRAILETLTENQRDVLLLRVLADLTVEQAAVVVGKSPGAVKALQARGLAHVRREIFHGAVTF